MTEPIDQVFDALAEQVVYIDTEHRVLWANRAAAEAIGQEVDDLIGKRCFELRHRRDEPCTDCPTVRTRETGKLSERHLTTPDGRILYIRAYPVFGDDGEATGYAEVTLDVTEHRRAEKRYRALFELGPHAVMMSDLHGKLIAANQPAAELLGYASPTALLESGRGILDLVAQDERHKVVAAFESREAADRTINGLEVRLDREDGALRHAEFDVATLTDSDGRPEAFIGVGHDVTDRVRSLERLRESETRFRELFENIATAVAVYEVRGEGEAFVFKDFNRAAEQIEQIDRSDVIGKDVLDVFPGVEQFGLLEVFRKVWRTGRPELFPLKLYDDDRVTGWRENYVYKLPTGELVAVYEDATQRRRAEEAQRSYTERLKTLRELDEAILAARTPAEIAQTGLEHLRRLVEFDVATLLMTDIDQIDDPEQATARVLGDLRTGGAPLLPQGAPFPVDPYRELLTRLEGVDTYYLPSLSDSEEAVFPLSAILAEGRNSALFITLISNEKRIGVFVLTSNRNSAFGEEQIAIAREIAGVLAIAIQQSALHEQVRHHADELEQRVAERTARLKEINDEMESFAYSVSHDLRAPLRAMQGLAKVLLAEHGETLGESGQDLADRIVASADGMDRLIQDLLEYSRVSRTELELKPVDLGSAVRVALGQLESVLAGAEVETTDQFQMVLGHPSMLVQVAANLISNAVKFVPEGTTPRLRVRSEDLGDRVRLWVEDNGIGIKPEFQERIFRVFERLHRVDEYPGTGIGLATVRKAAERLGGSVGVESEPGVGSRFWVELQKA